VDSVPEMNDGKKHGIRTRYQEGCRCDACRAWESARKQRRKAPVQPRPRQEVTEADMRWIAAYLQYLPKDRAGFSKVKREHWLDAVRVALDLIYEASDEENAA
jgi:hypothetical protein